MFKYLLTIINTILFQRYKIDIKKNLKQTEHCSRPFDTILIDKMGSCYACECQSWLPQSIGNLQIAPLDKIINSSTHKILKSSIDDGSYRYCNEHQCTYLKTGKFYHGYPNKIKYLRLAIDDSCNLQCPSCRTSLVFHKKGNKFNLGIRLADKINQWLKNCVDPIEVHIGSDGDPFASHVYRHFMKNTPIKQNIKYSLLTNGLMFKDFYSKVPWVIENLNELGISIDGASKETYEKLRLGGKWDKINENLQCISKLKEKYNFRFKLHFVVQKDNYHEMEDIIQLGKDYNADRVWFSRIQDWNTWSNFSEHNIFDVQHPQHSDYRKHLKKLVKRKSKIVEEATLRQLH